MSYSSVTQSKNTYTKQNPTTVSYSEQSVASSTYTKVFRASEGGDTLYGSGIYDDETYGSYDSLYTKYIFN